MSKKIDCIPSDSQGMKGKEGITMHSCLSWSREKIRQFGFLESVSCFRVAPLICTQMKGFTLNQKNTHTHILPSFDQQAKISCWNLNRSGVLCVELGWFMWCISYLSRKLKICYQCACKCHLQSNPLLQTLPPARPNLHMPVIYEYKNHLDGFHYIHQLRFMEAIFSHTVDGNNPG